MVAGNKILGLLGEERKAMSELKLSAKWAPHQGHNESYVDLRSELVHTARRAGLAFLLTAEGAVPPSNSKLEGRRTRFAQNEMQEMVDEWWQKNTLLFYLLDEAIDWLTDNMDPERDRTRVVEFMAPDGSWANGVGYREWLAS